MIAAEDDHLSNPRTDDDAKSKSEHKVDPITALQDDIGQYNEASIVAATQQATSLRWIRATPDPCSPIASYRLLFLL
jgi:hypothetical protein